MEHGDAHGLPPLSLAHAPQVGVVDEPWVDPRHPIAQRLRRVEVGLAGRLLAELIDEIEQRRAVGVFLFFAAELG